MKTQGKILIIRGGAIGDFILTLPVLAALREQFPQTHLEVLGYPHIAQLAVSGGWADATRPIEARALAGFFVTHGSVDAAWQEYFASFDVILSFLYDPSGDFRDNVRRCSRAQYLEGPHRPDERLSVHATETFLKPLERLAIFAADPIPRLRRADDEFARRRDESDRFRLALHPGSGSPSKNWPEARWDALLRHVVEATSWDLLLVGGEAEGDRLQRLHRDLPADRVTLADRWPLSELGEGLTECDGFVGHDSGITHLAVAAGTSAVVLWGETNPAIWRPRGERTLLLQDPGGLNALSVTRVWHALRDHLHSA